MKPTITPVQAPVGLCQGRVLLAHIFRLVQLLSQQWREMFESFDDNQDGIIDAGELSNALRYYKSVLFVLTWKRSLSESCLTTAWKLAHSSSIS